MQVVELPTGTKPSAEVLLGLADVPAGLALATTLSGIDRRQAGSLSAGLMVEARFRQANHERGELLADIAQFLSFWGPAGRVLGPLPRDAGGAVDEIAGRLHLSHRAGYELCKLAWELQRRLAAVLEAMVAGVLDEPKAKAFSEGTAGLHQDHTEAIVGALLLRAPEMTVPELRDEIAKLATAQDPEDALRRYLAARDERRVEGKRNRDGTGNLIGRNMSAVDIAVSCARLDRLARKVINAGVQAQLDHVRADILAGITTGRYASYGDEQIVADQVAGAPSEDWCYDGDEWPDPEYEYDPNWPNRPDWPDEPDEADPFDPNRYEPTAEGPCLEPDDEDPLYDFGDWDEHCPVCEHDPEQNGSDPYSDSEPDERPVIDYNTVLNPTRAADDDTDIEDTVDDGRRWRRRDGLRLILTLPTAVGLDRRPGTLQPVIGTVHAEAAKELMLAIPSWWCVLVDHTGLPQAVVNLRRRPGQPAPSRQRLAGELWLQVDAASLQLVETAEHIGLLDEGWTPVLAEILDKLAKATPGAPNGDPTVRFPGDSLRRFINLRDLTCTFPGCMVPAYQTQGDHLHDYALGGPTADFNLESACATHHRLHTEAGWTIRQDAPGHFTWISPTGRVFHRRPRSTLLNLPKPHPAAWQSWYPHPDPAEPGPDRNPQHCLEPRRKPRRGEPEDIVFPF